LGLQLLVRNLGLVEGLDAVEGSLDDEMADVGKQRRHLVSANLVAGRFEQVSQHPKASRELSSVVQPVKQDSVEQKRARRAAPNLARTALGEQVDRASRRTEEDHLARIVRVELGRR